VRDFLSLGASAPQSYGLSNELANSVLGGSFGHQPPDQVLDAGRLRIVERSSLGGGRGRTHGSRDHKTEDGSGRALGPAVAAFVRRLGRDLPDLEVRPLENSRGERVGELRALD